MLFIRTTNPPQLRGIILSTVQQALTPTIERQQMPLLIDTSNVIQPKNFREQCFVPSAYLMGQLSAVKSGFKKLQMNGGQCC